ncbi:MAG: Lon protease family protein [bacterium]
MAVRKLGRSDLYQRCDPEQLPFETTSEMGEFTEFIGQPRAVEALHFGIEIDHKGYNIFALGDYGLGKHTLIRQLLEDKAAQEKVPPDLCYVNNFEVRHKPRILHLPPGRGKELSRDMETLVADMQNALRAAFESEEYQNRQRTVKEEYQEKQREAFQGIQNRAREWNLGVLRTPVGIAFAPVREGEVVPGEEIQKWPEEERKNIAHRMEELQSEAQKILQKLPIWGREMQERVKELDREIAGLTIGPLLETLREKYGNIPGVIDFLRAVEKDIIDHIDLFRSRDGEEAQQIPIGKQSADLSSALESGSQAKSTLLRRYRVNVVVDHCEAKGTPVIYEDNPTYQNLIGRIEHLPVLGALITDFNMIRPGALHRANGGYLILDALKVLMFPFAWEGLKRVLRSGQIKIESLSQAYGMLSTITLEPEPTDLNLKVVLIGPPFLYYMLRAYDPEFGQLFKVAADFDYEMNRTPESQEKYGRLIAAVVRKEGLLPFDRTAVARAIEHSSRMIEDGKKLSLHLQRETDLLREADYWARKNGNDRIGVNDVQRAIDAWTFRSDLIRERVQERIGRDILLIDTAGVKAGQINGLSVMQLGEFAFGRPSRITARIRLGKGEVVDIEREVKMSGPIHSKGVLILSGFLGARYAKESPLSLSASLVFEQSYSGIEGDSASAAELYALLSAIAEVPVRQSLAVTGSINQHGQIQPIGGVNEKVEGFFDTCQSRELTGEQGVLIPASNVQHLMLRQDVIEAVEKGQFHIYSLETIDDGIEVLTGMPAGEPDERGKYPIGSFNGRVQERLAQLTQKRMEYSQAAKAGEMGES